MSGRCASPWYEILLKKHIVTYLYVFSLLIAHLVIPYQISLF